MEPSTVESIDAVADAYLDAHIDDPAVSAVVPDDPAERLAFARTLLLANWDDPDVQVTTIEATGLDADHAETVLSALAEQSAHR